MTALAVLAVLPLAAVVILALRWMFAVFITDRVFAAAFITVLAAVALAAWGLSVLLGGAA